MTECSRCGDCCENIPLSSTKAHLRVLLADPETSPESAATARFVLEHWHRSGGGGEKTRWSCDRFDPATRLCMAHDDRPPVCSGYPWYDGLHNPATVPLVHMPVRCSFWADVPPERRPPSWVPVEIGMSAP